MLIEQIIEFELRGPWLSGCRCALQLIISMTKIKSLRGLVFLA